MQALETFKKLQRKDELTEAELDYVSDTDPSFTGRERRYELQDGIGDPRAVQAAHSVLRRAHQVLVVDMGHSLPVASALRRHRGGRGRRGRAAHLR